MHTLRLFALMVVIASLSLDPLQAQNARVASARFDAATVRRIDARGRRQMTFTPDGLYFTNVTLRDCLAAAYSMESFQIEGPDWLSKDRYAVAARSRDAVKFAVMMEMLKELLEERFDLKIHRELREMPVYVLRVGREPIRLKNVDRREGVLPIPGGMTFQGMTLQEFTEEFLSNLPVMDRPVVNRTDLEGRYTFSLRIFQGQTPENGALKDTVAAGGPDLFMDALAEIGLTMARERMAMEVLVVDDANRAPEEN